MPLLNYTTKVSVDQTVTELHRILTKAKAVAVLTEFDTQGRPDALSFRIMLNESPMHFKLPANVSGVTAALKRDRQFRDEPHAHRVAWRILKDWVEAQMAIIEANMAELPQVFLPYAETNSGETVYQRIKSGGMLALTDGKKR